jgi:PEGA domain-containing protein
VPEQEKPGGKRRPPVGRRPPAPRGRPRDPAAVEVRGIDRGASSVEPIENIEQNERTVMELRVALGLPFVEPDASEDVTPRPAIEEAKAQADLAAVPERLAEAFIQPKLLGPPHDPDKTPPPRSDPAKKNRFVLHDVGTQLSGEGRLAVEIGLAVVFIGLAAVYSLRSGMMPKPTAPVTVVHAEPTVRQPSSWTDQNVQIRWDVAPPKPVVRDTAPKPGNTPKRTSFVEIPGKGPSRAGRVERNAIKRQEIETPPERANRSAPKAARDAEPEAPREPSHARAAHAMLTIISRPSGAAVIVNGKDLGRTPLVRPAPPGNKFSVHIKAGKHKEWSGSLSPDASGQFNLKVDLR